MTATVRLAGENHQPFSALWRFEQGQARNFAAQLPSNAHFGVGSFLV